MAQPLYIAFVWHMHQPYYRASRGGEFQLPWVRLHALKDYADMVDLLEDFPQVHQTFNLVPSLVEQLQEYADGAFRENHWDLTLKPAEDLDESERAFVIEFMCERSWHPRAQRYPRYLELARKREACLPLGLERCAVEFGVGDLRDLQVWFNLAWFDPIYLRQEPLSALVDRGRDFTEEDKATLSEVQAKILGRTISAYSEAERRGAVELTTSPYFHPILPLLANTDLARVSRPDVTLPPRRFAHPEDAIEQLDLGLAKHEEVFGRRPRGFWCSEMSIGEDVIVPLADRGIRWTIGDEEHLARSHGRAFTRSEAGHLHEPARLYTPYLLEREGRTLDIVFRDHGLSDLIGFTYQSWEPRDAAANLMWRLREIRRDLDGSPGPHLVTIALDGENAWEYYHDDGREFLRHLYQDLSAEEGFTCATVSEFLEEHPARGGLPWLHTGSWIFGDFSTWIGDPAHGRAWDLLHEARDTVAAKRETGRQAPVPEGTSPAPEAEPGGAAAVAEAWHHILVAEGSDWFWWFGEHQESDIDHLWDLNFRQQLQEAYRLVGEAPPPELFSPILAGAAPSQQLQPRARLDPVIDGAVSPPEEWETAGMYRAAASGTMQQAGGRALEELRYGASERGLHLLLKTGDEFFDPGMEFALYFSVTEIFAESSAGSPRDPLPAPRTPGREPIMKGIAGGAVRELVVRPLEPGGIQVTLACARDGSWGSDARIEEVATGQVIEITVPWGLLDLPAGTERLEIRAGVTRQGLLLELWPPAGALVLELGPIGVSTGGAAAPREGD